MRKVTQQQIRLRHSKEIQRNILATPGPYPLHIVLDHLKAGFNVGKIFRSAEIFGIEHIHMIGIPPFDPAPAKGALRKVPLSQPEDFACCAQALENEGYRLFVFDPDKGIPLPEAELPEKSAFVFGHEEFGHSFNPDDYPNIGRIRIPQHGATQSLNVSVAASIAMYEYCRRYPR